MSEAEYLNLANEYSNTSFMLVSILLSLLSAFLLASYLAAHQFNKIVSTIFLFVYSVAYFWIGGATLTANAQIVAFSNQMRAAEFDFSWVTTMDLGLELQIGNLLVLVCYLASIAFFFFCRAAQGKLAT